MRNVPASFLLKGSFLAALALLPGCSGGGSGSSDDLRIRCLDGAPFCVISCNLGCSQTGCSVTEIAENERLRFKFSDRVDPATVNNASISIRTATGVAPDGDFLVVDSEVTFVPRVSTAGGVSTFGFLRDESYIITIAGGDTASFGVRNLAGDALSQELNCTVRATLGIVDENQAPPTAELTSPVDRIGVDLVPTIVLKFSELIDTAPLQVPLGAASPIRVVLRGTLPNGECDRDAEGLALEGLPTLSTERVGETEVTVVTFRPTVELPGLSCISIYVTADIRDLAGRPATPAEFDLITESAQSVDINIVEEFDDASRQDPLLSGGVWSGGQARGGLVGSDGRHGSFSPAFGTPLGAGVFEWTLDQPGGILIPGSNTPSGNAFQVTTGTFYFTDFVLNEGQVLRFKGAIAPRIYVRGRVEIRGVIDLNAADMPANVPTSGPLVGQRITAFNARGLGTAIVPGQAGGAGGAGGGAGGAGGTECPASTLPASAANKGQVGQDVRVVAGHAYVGNVVGTGGRGADERPLGGTAAAASAPFLVGITTTFTFHDEFSPGGGGGGHALAGSTPITPAIPLPPPPNPQVPLPQPNNGPLTAGGTQFSLFPYPPVSPPSNYQSLDHFLVGGSGGGGGGSHTFGILTLLGDDYMAGHGGSGGGGAIAFRAGGDVLLASTGQVLLRGGRGVIINGDNPATPSPDTDFGASSPGGGGSGGSLVVQSGKNITVQGLIDASGGAGSRVEGVSVSGQATYQINVQARGGAGSSGFYRLEADGTLAFNGPIATVPTFDPATNAGPLTDRDDRSGDVSRWIGTGRIFPPTWLVYELDVDEDGAGPAAPTMYTDSGLPGTQKANNLAGPVTVRFQGARIGQDGSTPISGSIKPWREGIGVGAGPGIQQDSVTGFRFELMYNRGAFPNAVVTALRVRART